jgi:hypothetical protein
VNREPESIPVSYEDAPDTARSVGVEDDSNPGPVDLSTRVARLEGKVDLLATDVRSVLSQNVAQSKKLAAAKYGAAALAGVLTSLAPAHADKAGKILDTILALFG